MNPYRVASALVVALAVACKDAPDPRLQSLLGHYAPGLAIGDTIPDRVRKELELRVLPYTGFENPRMELDEGLRGLKVWVDEYIDDARPVVSPKARVEAVQMELPDAKATIKVRARITAVLGTPNVRCFPLGGGIQLRFTIWKTDGGGIRMMSAGRSGPGYVNFGAIDLPLAGEKQVKCDRAEY